MSYVYPGPKALPGPQLTALLELNLEGLHVDHEVLSKMTLLQVLSIHDGYSGCLIAMDHLQHLQHLHLAGLGLGHRSDLEAFSALTASTQLRSLNIGEGYKRVLPPGCAQHMFPLGKQWPFLTQLTLQSHDIHWPTYT